MALGVDRSSVRYTSHGPDQTALMLRIRNFAATRTRYGYSGSIPADTPIRMLAGAIKARWICEQAHQQLKEELASTTSKGDHGQGYTDMP